MNLHILLRCKVVFDQDILRWPNPTFPSSGRILNNLLVHRSRFKTVKALKFFDLQWTTNLCNQTWCLWSVGDKETIEKVQKRAVSMVSGLTGSSYTEKLIELNLQSLENRRLRYDLIETYIIIHGVNNVNKCTWFSM